MTTATKRPISIAQSIQADQEPRRFREMRERLAASKSKQDTAANWQNPQAPL